MTSAQRARIHSPSHDALPVGQAGRETRACRKPTREPDRPAVTCSKTLESSSSDCNCKRTGASVQCRRHAPRVLHHGPGRTSTLINYVLTTNVDVMNAYDHEIKRTSASQLTRRGQTTGAPVAVLNAYSIDIPRDNCKLMTMPWLLRTTMYMYAVHVLQLSNYYINDIVVSVTYEV